jgi:3-hydroxy-9,10-secoandrosta-1,3,5(10)-triene-9,17-dione monooxygenase reductase component
MRHMPEARVAPLDFRDACSHFATGVCVVTSLGQEGPAGMTANAVSSLSLEPPLMLVCFDRTARTLMAVQASGRFAIHFLAHDQEELAARFASKLPEAEKFAGARWSEEDGTPVLDGCLAGMRCTLAELLPGGDHVIGVGAVNRVWRGGGEPLVFYRGDYWSLGEREPAPAEVDEALEGP